MFAVFAPLSRWTAATGLGAIIVCLPVLGCAADPARQGSTAHADLQASATKAQTTAAAGLTVSSTSQKQVCTYDTNSGKVALTVRTADMCPPASTDLTASPAPP